MGYFSDAEDSVMNALSQAPVIGQYLKTQRQNALDVPVRDIDELRIKSWPVDVRNKYLKHFQENGNKAMSATEWLGANQDLFKGRPDLLQYKADTGTL